MKIKRLPKCKIRDLGDINEGRERNNLRPLSVKVRACIVCGSHFESIEMRTCGCQSGVWDQ